MTRNRPTDPFETRDIRIAQAGESVLVRANVTGQWAVHRRTPKPFRDAASWTVTHVPTGLALVHLSTRTRARHIAEAAAAVAPTWGRRLPFGKPPRRIPAALRRLAEIALDSRQKR